jgi:leucyl aminopeptidase
VGAGSAAYFPSFVSPTVLLFLAIMLTLSVRRVDLAALDTPLLVLGLPPGATITPVLAPVDAALGGALARTLERRDFRGGRDEVLHLAGGTKGPVRVLLVGLGKGPDRGPALRRAASLAARRAHGMGVGTLVWYAGAATPPELEHVAIGLGLGPWEYTDLKTPPPAEERRAALTAATIHVDDMAGAEQALATGLAIGAGYDVARRLAMMPGNVCTPDLMADVARDIAKRHALEVTVMGRRELESLRMGSFLSVAQGTPQDPRMIVLEYKGAAPTAKPIALVGKGLCFDSGGISIKPASGMEFMKFDMCGGAGVLGAMESIARLKLPINVVGVVGATTNMPSGVAFKPGDVVQAASGKYIEIINTDAEGRLVLADLLDYVRRYQPSAIVDAATLTGACVVALGHIASGVFGNDQALVAEVLAAGERAAERGWQMPVWDDYRDSIKSDVADIKNTGGRSAGAITAAKFLQDFVDTTPWVHLDIAGTAYSESDLVAIPKGPTGVPVGMFVEFARGRVR